VVSVQKILKDYFTKNDICQGVSKYSVISKKNRKKEEKETDNEKNRIIVFLPLFSTLQMESFLCV
jgi:hypothetical protein